MVMGGGHVLECGTPAALLAQPTSVLSGMVARTGSRSARFLHLLADGVLDNLGNVLRPEALAGSNDGLPIATGGDDDDPDGTAPKPPQPRPREATDMNERGCNKHTQMPRARSLAAPTRSLCRCVRVSPERACVASLASYLFFRSTVQIP